MFSEFWANLATSSAELIPGPFGSDAVDGVLALPAYILGTLSGGAALFGS